MSAHSESFSDETRTTTNVVVFIFRENDRKCLLLKNDGGKGWWLPFVVVDGGEAHFTEAALAAVSQTGVNAELTGILRIHQTSLPDLHQASLQITFYAQPAMNKKHGASKSAGLELEDSVRWFSLDQIHELIEMEPGLLGNEPIELVKYIREGGKIHPLSILKETSLHVLKTVEQPSSSYHLQLLQSAKFSQTKTIQANLTASSVALVRL
ncbi:uncharacterized protein LOC144364072 [Saccoglossus kowalevskii]